MVLPALGVSAMLVWESVSQNVIFACLGSVLCVLDKPNGCIWVHLFIEKHFFLKQKETFLADWCTK